MTMTTQTKQSKVVPVAGRIGAEIQGVQLKENEASRLLIKK